MLKLWTRPVHPSHEDLFVERYEWLHAKALQIAQYKRELAEDLVHDVFVHFMLARPDLGSIRNLDGYLFVTLRNMHLSHIRRATRRPEYMPLLVEFDSAEIGLRALDQLAHLQTRQELLRICRYACIRKESSRSGSVFLLRFVHGYYPGEIARILCSPRRAADDWLRIARREIQDFLEGSEKPSYLPDADSLQIPPLPAGLSTQRFLHFLVEMVFSTRTGECPPVRQLRSLYGGDRSRNGDLDASTLAHSASCARCLDEINQLLGIPRLADRHPTDSTGPQPPASQPPGPPPPAGHFGGKGALRRNGRRRAAAVFEHHPKELFVSVNGFILGSQRIGSETSEQTLTTNLTEKVSFVEVLSEQGIRLLWMGVDAPAEGSAEQQTLVHLSDNRTVAVRMDFSGPWPQVHVNYHDPGFEAVPESGLEPEAVRPASGTRPEPDEEAAQGSFGDRVLSFPGRLSLWTLFTGRWRPAAIMAMLTLVALVVHQVWPPTMSAAVLLQRSARAERELYSDPQSALHRTLYLEKRPLSGRGTGKRFRIEFWQSASKGVRTQRFYDEQGLLLAQTLIQPDGKRSIYWQDGRQQVLPGPGFAGPAINSSDEIWVLGLTVESFVALLDQIDKATVVEDDNLLIIRYAGPSARFQGTLVRMSLSLDKKTLYPVSQVLLVQREEGLTEYHWSETTLEKKPNSAVRPEVFDVDPELAGPPPAPAPAQTRPALPAPAPLQLSRTEMLALEIDLLDHLDQAGANLGEGVTVRRLPEGRLELDALVETESRKQEILAALTPHADNPAVTSQVRTFTEALEQEPAAQPTAGMLHQIDLPSARIPTHQVLHEYFSAQARNERGAAPGLQERPQEVEKAVQEFAGRVLKESRESLLHAWALKHLWSRFTPEERALLDPKTRATFCGILERHLAEFEATTGLLQMDLAPIFFSSGEAPVASAPPEALQGGTWGSRLERMFDLAYANERTIRQAFTVVYPPRQGTARDDLQTLSSSLLEAENLARDLRKALGAL